MFKIAWHYETDVTQDRPAACHVPFVAGAEFGCPLGIPARNRSVVEPPDPARGGCLPGMLLSRARSKQMEAPV